MPELMRRGSWTRRSTEQSLGPRGTNGCRAAIAGHDGARQEIGTLNIQVSASINEPVAIRYSKRSSMPLHILHTERLTVFLKR